MVFRTDASTHAGTGHVMRCLTLAEALRDRGADVQFVCRDHEGNLAALLSHAKLPFSLLPREEPEAGAQNASATWLGAPEEADAAQTMAALGGGRPDWIVADHYGIGVRWESAVRARALKILAIDDIADRAHDCDVLLDQNHSQHGPDRYRGLVPQPCRLLLGPRYALLRAEYSAARAARQIRAPEQGAVFVYFGGTDAGDMTGRTLQALADTRFSRLRAEIVVGVNNAHRESIAGRAASRPHTVLHGPRPELAGFMERSELAIGAGGTTTWERLCVGVPSLVVAVAENQVPACEALAADGVVVFLGTEDRASVEAISAALDESLQDKDLLAERTRLGCALVDGLGTRRIVELLLPTDSAALCLRKATADDRFLYYGWVNDPETRKQSLRPGRVTLAEHLAWFDAKLEGTDSRLYVLEARGLPVGQIRFDARPDSHAISYSIDPDFRGRGWAKRLVELGLQDVCALGPAEIRATVKTTNSASHAVFRGLGFNVMPTASDSSQSVYRLRIGLARSRSHAD